MSTATSPDLSRGSGTHDHVHPSLALAVIATAQLMVVLDATIVNIALPHIKTALHFSPTGLSWVLNAYTLVFGGLLLLGGRAGDLFGRRRMFVAGVLIFALASLAGGFAWNAGWLLAMRALQGIGGAIASPTALALITTTFEEGPARNKAFGVYAAVSGAGAAIGLILGGVLTSELSWRWVLFVNAPIGVALAIVTPMVIGESERTPGRFALPDAVTSTGGMAALVYGFINAADPSHGWGDTTTVVSFAIAAVLLLSFLVIESRSAQPLLPLRLFENRTRNGAYLVMLITGAAVFAMFYFLTQFVQNVIGFSPLTAGFAFLPVSATIVVVAQIVSRLVGRIETRFLIGGGAIFAGCGLYELSSLTVHSGYATKVLPGIMLIAVGMGLIFVPITLAAVSGVASQDSGIASAMLNVGQQVGGTIGLSALVTIFGHAAGSQAAKLHQNPYMPVPFTHGADAALTAGAVFMAVALVVAVVLIRVQPQDTPNVPAVTG
ncbi:MAG TPA: MFS transporter [Mycobacteriales bacterium]|nr:MFS transporter [Mycobacteriales bacterium]